MTAFSDRLNDYINSHPRECLYVLLTGAGLLWQSTVLLAALFLYAVFPRCFAAPRWVLFPIGLLIAVAVLCWQPQPAIVFMQQGFILNRACWQAVLHGDLVQACGSLFQQAGIYVGGFSVVVAGLFSLIDLLSDNVHAATMQSLQQGTTLDTHTEINEKQLQQILTSLKDEACNGTLLGVSKYSGKPVVMADRDVNQVVLVLGTTGAGKTITLRRFYRRAVWKGCPLLIVDGKPDAANVQYIKELAQQQGRPFFCFNCDANRHYDPLAQGGFTELKDKIVCLKDEWSNDYYRSIAETYLQTTLQVLLATQAHITLEEIVQCLTYKHLVALVNTTKNEKLMKRVQQLKNYEMKDITGLQAHLEILIHSELGYFFEKDASSFSLIDVIEQQGVVYFALPALRYPSFSKVLGKLVINDIKAVIERYSHSDRPIFTVFDEFSVFAGEQVLNLVNMGRGKGIHAIFGTQGLADLERVDASFKSQVLNCVNTLICHRLNDQESAEAVANWIGTKDGFTVTAQLDLKQPNTSLGTVKREREYIVHPDDIKQRLQTGEAFYVTKVDGFKREKVRVKFG